MDEIEVEVVDTELGEGVIKSTFDILGSLAPPLAFGVLKWLSVRELLAVETVSAILASCLTTTH